MDPAYVSSVDSGNLAGHLIALANTCEEWTEALLAPEMAQGLRETLSLTREAIETLVAGRRDRVASLTPVLDEMESALRGDIPIDAQLPMLQRLSEKATRAALGLTVPLADTDTSDLLFWVGALSQSVLEQDRDRRLIAQDPEALRGRLRAVAHTARTLAMGMDFTFLFDPKRKLLSIGYSLANSRLDPTCYNLLASEARLASLFAIAKGDIPTRHWFHLGRETAPLGSGFALVSWSGSMFEYLMPSLVMRAPPDSLLERTSRLVVTCQKAYGRALGVPWGISESAYNARDPDLIYQYSAFGVPGLGLKRGLADNVVIAPYATALAAMVDPAAAVANFARLAQIGARGRHGFYEALDYTPLRLSEGEDMAVVHCFMAHHQGMTLVALDNVVHKGRVRLRFHRERMIQSCDLLLQERVPRDVLIPSPSLREGMETAAETLGTPPATRHLGGSPDGPPQVLLLSNGSYAVMISAGGGGYSRWRTLAITRWHEDVTRDDAGSLIFLRNLHTGLGWSACGAGPGSVPDTEEVVFDEDRALFTRRDGALTTSLEVLVSGEDDAEVRRLSVCNSGFTPVEVEITSYAELVLGPAAMDATHPAFAKLFVETAYLPEVEALIATRRSRAPTDPAMWAAHFAVVEGPRVAAVQYESDRARFLGRNRTVATAQALQPGARLSNTTGVVLDPVFALRHRVVVAPGAVACVFFWTLAAPSRPDLLSLIDKHHDHNAFDRAKALAWTQGQIQLHHLGIEGREAADFQRLAAPLLYADPRFRSASQTITTGVGPQSGMWALGISGDLPVVVLTITDIADLAQVRQMLRAHEYWRIKGLAVDLVILNEHASSYRQDLQAAVEGAVRHNLSRPRGDLDPGWGTVYALRTDLMSLPSRALLLSVARVVLGAGQGVLSAWLARRPPPPPRVVVSPRLVPNWRISRGATPPARPVPTPSELEFFNGLGGFDDNGRVYVIHLENGRTTPLPWINVIANPQFGFQVSAEGSGYTWAGNSRENQLTPWSNDPVSDPAGEALYLRDEVSGAFWCPTAQPRRDDGPYTAHHGFGFSRFDHTAHGIATSLVQSVPLAEPVKISRLTLRNLSGLTRHVSVTAYVDWVLGSTRGTSGPFLVTACDEPTGAVLARNPWRLEGADKVAFLDMGGSQTSWTADRTEFLGRHGTMAAPAALTGRAVLSGHCGVGLDPCGAVRREVVLEPGQTLEVVIFLGQGQTLTEARALIMRWRNADLDQIQAEVKAFWDKILGAVQVKSPDRAMDILLNGWLLYQTIACRLWARAAFYQASGAYGFRDQVQDGMALSLAWPEETRRHLLSAASRQFVEGDVQHWWMPDTGLGVRTHISDDRVWLAFAIATYVRTSGDVAVLDEMVPFLDGPALLPGDADACFQPTRADVVASLFEHGARGIDQALSLRGENGLPLIGTGDWNDGMNRVGSAGRGESVWLGWLLCRTLEMFAALADPRDPSRARHWRTEAKALRHALEGAAWDGAWYRRATYDDGSWLGSSDNDECRIDSIAQSWAVLSGVASPARGAVAMESLARHLLRPQDGVALLFEPPFAATLRDPGYIKGYPPGLRENGGQYTHAALWAVLAFARLGDGDKAEALFALLNPIRHALTPEAVERYKVEPYVVAADVYAVAPHIGRGGWTWYTGAAGWMSQAGIEGLLGLRRQGAVLVMRPCLPRSWEEVEITLTIDETRYVVCVERRISNGTHLMTAQLDGRPVPCLGGCFRAPLDQGQHTACLTIHE
ncbi:GH36-type glycosyl hydrolase domain-containing protein [Pararhodospirillum photometricum]|nr:glucoamylase family protein [Pararhodospirillum photometricum]